MTHGVMGSPWKWISVSLKAALIKTFHDSLDIVLLVSILLSVAALMRIRGNIAALTGVHGNFDKHTG